MRVSAIAAPPTPSRSPSSTGSVSGVLHQRAGWGRGCGWGDASAGGGSSSTPVITPPLPPLPQVKHAMTMTEKILAKHSSNTQVVPGQNIWTSVDKLLTHDVCGPGTFGIFQKEFGEDAQVRAAVGGCPCGSKGGQGGVSLRHWVGRVVYCCRGGRGSDTVTQQGAGGWGVECVWRAAKPSRLWMQITDAGVGGAAGSWRQRQRQHGLVRKAAAAAQHTVGWSGKRGPCCTPRAPRPS